MLDRFHCGNEMENDPTNGGRNRQPSELDNNNMNVDDNVDEEENDDFDDEEFGDEFGPQEFSALNNQLDELETALDSLESRNDDIHSKLLDLLRSSREIRQVMVEENKHSQSSSDMVVEEDVGDEGSEANSSNRGSGASGGTSSSNGSSQNLPTDN